MMPKFNVLKNFKGSPDGHTVIEYKKGETAELEGDLAKVALEEKWVKPSKAAEKDAKAKAEAEAEAKAEAEQAQKLVGEEAYRAALDDGATEEEAESARAQAVADFLA
jgi:hypothetical protein